MGTCVRCGFTGLRESWEWRTYQIGRHVLSGRVATVRCPSCGTAWPWVHPRARHDAWRVARVSPALAYLQAEGDLIVVRWPDGSYEVVT
jgi:predicted RNA-binding Zn-ribbon protein involved in translation (DUF1610 family)